MDRGLIALDADVISPRIEFTPDEEVQADAGGMVVILRQQSRPVTLEEFPNGIHVSGGVNEDLSRVGQFQLEQVGVGAWVYETNHRNAQGQFCRRIPAPGQLDVGLISNALGVHPVRPGFPGETTDGDVVGPGREAFRYEERPAPQGEAAVVVVCEPVPAAVK